MNYNQMKRQLEMCEIIFLNAMEILACHQYPDDLELQNELRDASWELEAGINKWYEKVAEVFGE